MQDAQAEGGASDAAPGQAQACALRMARVNVAVEFVEIPPVRPFGGRGCLEDLEGMGFGEGAMQQFRFFSQNVGECQIGIFLRSGSSHQDSMAVIDDRPREAGTSLFRLRKGKAHAPEAETRVVMRGNRTVPPMAREHRRSGGTVSADMGERLSE